MTSLRSTLRSPNLRVHGPLAAAAACLLALTACSGTTGDAASGKQELKPIESFTYGIPTPPSSLDLTKNMNGWTSAVAVMVTQPLERFDSAGKATPVLASKVTTPTDTSVVYDLRADVTFSDGKKLTAADVVAAFKHAIDGAGGAQTASILTSIADVKATGDAQVTVTLAHPDPAIRGSVAFGVLVAEDSVMKAAGADYGTAAGLPIGTGPYVYSSFKADKVELTSNPHYSGSAPRIKKLTFAGFTTDTTAQLALRSGEVQANYVNAPKSTPQWKSINGATVFSTPSLLSSYLTFDTTKPPFNDVHARLAVAHLIDRQSLARVAYGTEAQVMRSMAPDAEFVPLAGSADAVGSFMSGLPQVSYDPGAAAKELALSGTPTGFSIDVPYPSTEPFAEPVLLSLQQAAKPLGITVNLKPQTFIQWATDIYMFKPAPLGVFQIGDLQPDPNGGMALMVSKANAAPTKFNMASWAPQDVEPLAMTMTQSGDRAGRWAAASSILTKAAEQMPYVPLFAPNTVLVYGDGFSSSTAPDFMAFITGAWLDTLTGNGK